MFLADVGMAETRRHPPDVGVEEIGEKFSCPLICQRATLIEDVACVAQVGFNCCMASTFRKTNIWRRW